MKKYIICGVLLVVMTIVLGFFIKYHPFEEKQTLGVRDEMAIRHVAERNNVPIDALIPLLPPREKS